ncbi:MAG TPA: TSUP family transporter [Bacteroidales bacterium]|nr:TSUP family transporter [Bacteroidales bacterium]
MTLTTAALLIIIGLFAGVFSGMIGLGGGLIIIPALILLLHLDQHTAQGTSLAIMLPPIGLMATLNYYKAGAVNLKYAAIIALTFFIGGWFGSKLALNISADILRKVFAISLLVIAVRLLFD